MDTCAQHSTDTPTVYKRLAELGYDLIPIIPPGAPLSRHSTIPPDQLGKVPGRPNAEGAWGSYDWRRQRLTAKGWERALRAGCGLGIRAGAVIGLDIDVLDAGLSQQIAELAEEILGAAPERIGCAPKRLLVYRAEGDGARSHHHKFRLPDGSVHLVEVRGEGYQFVVEGLHPATGQPYYWTNHDPLTDYAVEDLVVVDEAAMSEFFAALEMALDLVGAEVVASGAGGAHGRDWVDQEQLAATDLQALADAMAKLPNSLETREEYIRMGAAIKAAFAADEGLGYDVYFDWAMRWEGNTDHPEGNTPEQVESDWARLKPPFEVGATWLAEQLRAAKVFDVTTVFPPVSEEDLAGVDQEAGQAARQARDRFWDGYAYALKLDRFIDLKARELLKESQFSRLYIGREGAKKLDGPQSAAAIWLRDLERRTLVASVTYRPAAELIVAEPGVGLCVNMWRPGPIASWLAEGGGEEASLAPWLDLLRRLVPEEEHRAHLLDWLAFQVQHPGVKCNWHPLLWGKPGIGKDTLLQPLLYAFGENALSQPADDLGGTWNDWLVNRQFIVLQEVHTAERRSVMNSIKVLLAAPPDMLKIKRRFMDEYEVPNIVNMVMLSNHADALALEPDDRRVFVLELMTHLVDRDYFIKLYDWMAGGAAKDYAGSKAVVRWLAARDLSGFNAKGNAPMTAAKQEMTALSRRVGDSLLVNAIEEQAGIFARDLVTTEEVRDYLRLEGVGQLSPQRVGRMLRDLGATQLPQLRLSTENEVTGLEGGRIRLWALRNAAMFERMIVGGRQQQVVAAYLEQQAVQCAADKKPVFEVIEDYRGGDGSDDSGGPKR